MDKRKEEIVEVALKRFAHYGFNKTTMNEIAEDLNITKANLYYYYPDKLELIKDVIKHVTNEIHQKEKKIIATYRNNFLETMFSLLEVRSSYLKKYYVLHINENLEWIKGVEINEFLKECHKEDLNQLKLLITRAVDAGEVVIEDVDETCSAYIEIIKGISIMHNVHDIITGIPNSENVDKILRSQKRATKLIFENRINTK
ncbi:TetR/AcrR family transcriptional regulator [Sphingobacterium sp. SGG-5]|uniref:TetR/AcrR family transcriptional regulator n=1 Tax=Sphingobacterium sp. SGG-5 TaxID=2710881 RepID=UPI0013EA08A7|nr:TetR/AcrR family transcriptional regulator [Sphingobacterium sp. SGG-5]NGM61861.1 TetR/AcrR family transcriptional regulator [Sphingobacterium sp. SGG-5]